MLTLVAAVLVYDLAYESVLERMEGLVGWDERSLESWSRNAISETRWENDMFERLRWQRNDPELRRRLECPINVQLRMYVQ